MRLHVIKAAPPRSWSTLISLRVQAAELWALRLRDDPRLSDPMVPLSGCLVKTT
jgi:hypothetical protein